LIVNSFVTLLQKNYAYQLEQFLILSSLYQSWDWCSLFSGWWQRRKYI